MPTEIKHVVVADRLISRFASELEDGLDGSTWAHVDRHDVERLRSELGRADVFVGSALSADLASAAPNLRLVHAAGAGVDGIAADALPRDVLLANVHEHGTSIAEYVMMAMLTLRRDLRRIDADLRTGVWTNPAVDSSAPLPSTIAGGLVGLVGYGHIGQAVAQAARALGMRVRAIRRRPELSHDDPLLEHIGGPEELHDLAAAADALVIVIPLDDSSRGAIDADVIARMRPDAVLINVARGPVVDEHALHAALTQRRIAGAALDVWWGAQGLERTPSAPATLDFGALDNVLMTPHISGVTVDTFRRRARRINENLHRLRADEPLENLIERR